jgi:tetratricopeptide (TPR) repeat protein
MTAGILVAVAGALVLAAAKPALPPAVPVPSPTTPREAFDRGRTAFVRAEYGRAIEILHPLLYPEVLLDSEGEIVQAHRMLGVSYLFENKPDDARREFLKLLALRPDYRFDPLLDPQRVVDYFNGVLKDAQAEIALMEARRRQREQTLAARREREAKLSLQPPTVLRYERHSYVVNFLPFGAGQFQNDQPRKGWVFLGIESALAAVSVGAFVTNFALYGVEPRRKCQMMQEADAGGLPTMCRADQIDHAEEDRSRLLLRVQVVSGGLFFAVAIWGVIDAIRHYQHEVRLSDSSPPPSGGTARLLLGPTGVGAAWTF